MRRIVPLLLAAALFPRAAAAQGQDQTRVPMDPSAICDALADAYKEAPLEERIIVTVKRDAVSRSEPVTMRLWPGAKGRPPRLELLLGPLHVWTTDDTLYATHSDDDDTYLAEPIGPDGPLAAIERALPPIPVPDLTLALATDHACPASLPYAPAIQWNDAVVNAEARPAQAHLTGTSNAGSGGDDDDTVPTKVELIADLEPPILRWYVIDNPDEGLRIEGEVRRSPAPSPTPPSIDVSGRTRVTSLAALIPADTLFHAGATLPTILVHPARPGTPGVAAPLVPIRGPVILILFKEWNKDAPAAIAAAQRALEGIGGYAIWPVAVLDDPTIDTKAAIDAIKPKVDPLPLYFTPDAKSTIARVDPLADVAILIVDDAQTIRLADGLDKFSMKTAPDILIARIAAAITKR